MDENEILAQYFELCKRMYLRMEAEGSWPWKDSQISEDMVDSNHID